MASAASLAAQKASTTILIVFTPVRTLEGALPSGSPAHRGPTSTRSGTRYASARCWGLCAEHAPTAIEKCTQRLRALDSRLCHTLRMRVVGHHRIPGPQLTPRAQGLGAARAHQSAGLALAAVPTTGIRHGIYRFASHEEMNCATEEALVDAIRLNARAREAVRDPEHDR